MSAMRPPSADNSSDHAAPVIQPAAGRAAVLLGRDVDHARFAGMGGRARAGSPGSLVVEGVCGVASAGQDRDAAVSCDGTRGAESLRVLRSRVDDVIAAIAIPVPKTGIRIARYFQ